MWFWWFILLCDLLVPVIMFVGGIIMSYHCPNHINAFLGYRTARSMKNTDTWKFAHEYCGKLWWKVGLASFVITILTHLPFYHRNEDTIGILSLVSMVFQIIILIVPIYFTEKALKRTYEMNNVNKTLYIPLYGKAYVSKKGIILKDEKAEEIWAAEGFLLKGKGKSKWLAYYMGTRAAVFDEWLEQQMTAAEDAVVIHIGCGMDSRVLRVGTKHHKWYDVDFPEVIDERKKYFTETDAYKMIGGDIREGKWMECITKRKRAIVVMEGVSMYLNENEVRELTARLSARFEQLAFLMDCYTVLAAKMSKYRNPKNEVGVTKVYGIDEPELFQSDDFVYVKEHELTPQKYIDELTGVEKHIFAKLYAGSFSKKLYRLFEYGNGFGDGKQI